jgi:acetolactate synthase small subunit
MIIARLPQTKERQAEIRELVETRGGKVINEESDAVILEFTGDKEELEEILTRLEALGMEDFARSGVIALERGKPSA